jgi:hypothetical protein
LKTANRIRLICLLMGFGVPVLCAKDFATYRVGSVVGADIVTPVALDVIDPTATAALKSTEALKTPAIFRSYAGVTNTLASQFQIAFDETRSNFISAIQDSFHQTVLDHAAVTSPDFGYLVTAFNITNKKFPIPNFLAMDWAYGKTGEAEKIKLLNALLQAMQNSIRPDDSPDGLNLGETLRLVPVKNPDEKLTLGDTDKRGQIISTENLITLSQARMELRRAFADYDELPLARGLSEWLQPNCLPDPALTQTARDFSVHQLVVAEHYAAGQIIAAQDSVIDAKTKAALDALSEKSNTENFTAASNNQPIAGAPVVESSKPSAPLVSVKPAQNNDAVKIPTQTVGAPEKIISHNNAASQRWLFVIGIFMTAGILILLGRFILRRRTTSISVLVKDLPPQNSIALQTQLAPQLARIVRETLVQELALQRRDLLFAQQAAAAEVSRLVRKMDGLQLAMQERLQTYESQIQKLELELAARTEENRELIRLKIEMIREQLAVETAGERMEFN